MTMWRDLLRNVLLMSVFGAILSGSGLPAQAGEIRDDGAFFSKPVLDKANARLAELHREFGKEVRIETFKTVPGGRGDEVAKMSQADRARYFEKWTRDRATTEHVKGIFVLISRHPGHIEIAVDKQTRDQGFGPQERTELRDKFMSGFKHEKYDEALMGSIESLHQTFKTKLHTKTGAHAPIGAAQHGRGDGHNQPAAAGHGMGWLGWVLIIGAIFLGIRLIGLLFGGMSRGGYPTAGGYSGGPGYGGGGGGFFSSLMTGMLGAVAGNWLYHSMFGGSEAFGHGGGFGGGDYQSSNEGAGEDFQTSGGDFDSGDTSDGGGDFGGGDFGGGDFGGGDFGSGGDF
jgi:hypothetical protein